MAMPNVPRLTVSKKTGLIAMGIILGVVIHILRNALCFVEFKSFTPGLKYLDYLIGGTEVFSYIVFVALALFLIRRNWRNLSRLGLIDQFRVLPENRSIYRRAILAPLFLVFTPAITTFTAMRLVSGTLYAGFHDAILMLLGFVSPSSGRIYTCAFSIHHAAAIFLLAAIAAIPTWRDLMFPSIARTGIMLALAICIPIVIFAFELIYSSVPPVVVQMIFIFILAMCVVYETRTTDQVYG